MPEGKDNPRPVERPSRVVEALQRPAAVATNATKREPGQGEPGKLEEVDGAGGEAAGKGQEKAQRGIFRVSGMEAFGVARAAGWKFFPRGAKGGLDGTNTVVEIQPGLPYSMVQGPVLTQRRTLPTWSVISDNTFFLFTDASGRSRSMAPGWTVREVRLSGDGFQWVRRPEAGASSPSMVVRLIGGRSAQDTVVRVDGMVLEGPAGASDWREAFQGK